MLPAVSGDPAPPNRVRRSNSSEHDTLSLSSLDLADEESWLYKSPTRQVKGEAGVRSSAIDWMRQDFDQPSREVVSARRSLFKQLTTLANQTSSRKKDDESERSNKRRSLCEDELDYKLSDVTDVQIMARLQEDKLRQSLFNHEVSDKPRAGGRDIQRTHSLDRRQLRAWRRGRSSSTDRSHSRERNHDDSDRFHDDAYYSEESNSGGDKQRPPADSDENIPPSSVSRRRNRSGSTERKRSTSHERTAAIVVATNYNTFDRNDIRRHTYSNPRRRTQSHDPREKLIINKQAAPRQVLSTSPDNRQTDTVVHHHPTTLTDLRNVSLNEEPEPLQSPQQRHQILFQKAKENQRVPAPVIVKPAPPTNLTQPTDVTANDSSCSPSQIPATDRKQSIVLPGSNRGSGIPVRQKSSIPRPLPATGGVTGGLLYSHLPHSKLTNTKGHRRSDNVACSSSGRMSLPLTPSMNPYATYTKKPKSKRSSIRPCDLVAQATVPGGHQIPYSTPCSDADDDEFY